MQLTKNLSLNKLHFSNMPNDYCTIYVMSLSFILIKVAWGSFMSQNYSVLFILTFDWLKIILNLYQLTFLKNDAESNSGVKK